MDGHKNNTTTVDFLQSAHFPPSHRNPWEMAYGSQTVSFLVKEHSDKRAARQASDGHGFQIFKQLLNYI